MNPADGKMIVDLREEVARGRCPEPFDPESAWRACPPWSLRRWTQWLWKHSDEKKRRDLLAGRPNDDTILFVLVREGEHRADNWYKLSDLGRYGSAPRH